MYYSGIADEAGRALDVQIRAHKELGWDHIELRNVGPTTLAYASEEEFRAMRGALDKAGMRVSCVASQIANWSRDISEPADKDIDELRRAIPRMRDMDVNFIRIMSYTNKNKLPEAQWQGEVVKRVKELARMAEDGDVTLVHENCDGWAGLGPKQTLRLLNEVGSPALRLVFDTGNPVSHKQDAFEYYSEVKGHVVYIHIKDYDVKEDRAEAVFPGEGRGRVREILTDLIAMRYRGGISIEPHMKAVAHAGISSPAEAMYATYVEYGRRLMRLVKDIEAARKGR